MTTDLFIGLVIGIISTISIGYMVWSHQKIKELQKIVFEFPSPEDFAKEVMKVKLPLAQLPPEVLEALKTTAINQEQYSNTESYNITPEEKKGKKMSYVG